MCPNVRDVVIQLPNTALDARWNGIVEGMESHCRVATSIVSCCQIVFMVLILQGMSSEMLGKPQTGVQLNRSVSGGWR